MESDILKENYGPPGTGIFDGCEVPHDFLEEQLVPLFLPSGGGTNHYSHYSQRSGDRCR